MSSRRRSQLRNRCGLTLAEMIVGALILALIALATYHMLMSGRRGSQRGQELADHVLVETGLYRAFETDVRAILPHPIRTSTGLVGSVIGYAPSNIAATEVLFWRFLDNGVQQVRYLFDPAKGEVRREEVDAAGQPLRTSRFGTGMVTDFAVRDDAGAGEIIRVSITMKGKLRTTTTTRCFSHGFPRGSIGRHWVFQVAGG